MEKSIDDLEVHTQKDGKKIERDATKPVKVTLSDPFTGEVLEERVIMNDYILVTAGNRYVKSMQILGRTHMIAIAVVPK